MSEPTKIISKVLPAATDIVLMIVDSNRKGPSKASLEIDLAELDPDKILKLDVEQLTNKIAPTVSSLTGDTYAPAIKGETKKIDYCLECLSKHLNTAKVLTREAIQRIEAGEPAEMVLEKVRGTVAELAGAEDDSNSVTDQEVRKLNETIRSIRKTIWNKGLELEPGSKDDLTSIYSQIDSALNQTYSVAKVKRERLVSLLEGVESKARLLKEAVKAGQTTCEGECNAEPQSTSNT
jgi:hypothetical protein